MPTITQHAPGSFCWPELASTDANAAKKFYGGLFGWTFNDNPMGPGEVYTIFQLDGRDCAALYNLRPDMLSMGIPPHWASYVAVANADEAVAKAKASGATILKDAFDVMEAGRMAVIQDPLGAAFCVWQAKGSPGVGVLSEPGSLAWSQLNTPDPGKAKPFYSTLFGYKTQDDPMPDGKSYTTLLLNGQPVGGIMPMPPNVPAGTPSHWQSYFASADVDGTAAKATSLGGTVLVPPVDIPGTGRFAVIQDPQGAIFATIHFRM